MECQPRVQRHVTEIVSQAGGGCAVALCDIPLAWYDHTDLGLRHLHHSMGVVTYPSCVHASSDRS